VHHVAATATVDGKSYVNGYVPIDYEHITPQRIYRDADVTVHAIDIAVPSKLNVAYVRGVGDNVEPALEQLGIPVTVLEPRAIPTIDLSKFTTVVVGPRAYQASRDLIDNNSYLLNFAKNGGTLVVQYGQYEMTHPGMMPYAISIARPHDRVTEENAPITVIDEASPVVKSPNEITPADFASWVQERSLYMPRTFDAHYHPVVELNDPGEQSNKGGILVTPYGRGLYVYTTLSFFRQLPAAVGGAARLFVNILSLSNGDGSSRTTAGNGNRSDGWPQWLSLRHWSHAPKTAAQFSLCIRRTGPSFSSTSRTVSKRHIPTSMCSGWTWDRRKFSTVFARRQQIHKRMYGLARRLRRSTGHRRKVFLRPTFQRGLTRFLSKDEMRRIYGMGRTSLPR
jgi:hypothetical protein